mmetsp:Transcript_48888/g.49659  ORF Transcript_48888/g.49659 Transcript_48888/m.49659 type:complete len:82 (-) Transcript_48888:126-371(-)
MANFKRIQTNCLRNKNNEAVVRQEGENCKATRIEKETEDCEKEQQTTRCTRHSNKKIRTLHDSIIQQSKYMAAREGKRKFT